MNYNYFSKEMLDYLVAKFKGYFDKKINISDKGAADGVAALNEKGLIVDSELPIVEITYEDYMKIPEGERNSNNINYFITNLGELGTAKDVTYDNSKSGLEAKNVQTAIDKLAENGGGSSETVVIDLKPYCAIRTDSTGSAPNATINSAILRRNGNVCELDIAIGCSNGFAYGETNPIFDIQYNDITSQIFKRRLHAIGYSNTSELYQDWSNGWFNWWFFLPDGTSRIIVYCRHVNSNTIKSLCCKFTFII